MEMGFLQARQRARGHRHRGNQDASVGGGQEEARSDCAIVVVVTEGTECLYMACLRSVACISRI